MEGAKGPVAAFGLPSPHKVHLFSTLARNKTVLVVTSTDSGAERIAEGMRAFGVNAAAFLPRETPLTHVHAVSGEREVARIHALTLLCGKTPAAVVCSAGALMQVLAPKAAFTDMLRTIHTGESVEPRTLLRRLTNAGYERVELVEGRGRVAARGDIVDVYPPQSRYPVRIEFFGDEIDQMRLFDPVTQRSIEQIAEILLPPAYETPQPKEAMARALKRIAGNDSFLEQERCWSEGIPCPGADVLVPLLFARTVTLLHYLPENTLLLLDEALLIDEALRTEELRFGEQMTAMLERGEGTALQGELEVRSSEILSHLNTGRTLLAYSLSRTHAAFSPKEVIHFSPRPAPQYMGDFSELARDLEAAGKAGDRVVLYAGEHAGRVLDALDGRGDPLPFADTLTRLPAPGEALLTRDRLTQGFAYPELHIIVLTEYELFGKEERKVRQSRKRNALTFSELAVGDYIVHEAHGIGRFIKVEPLTVQGNTRDYLLIEYKGGDRLYIPTDQLDRIQKYIGGGDEDVIPPLSKLGGSDWTNRVTKAKSAAKKLAVDLAALYALRAGAGGFAFSADSPLQKQFEERFPYDETPDQLQSIQEIKADMERAHPMDRLLCGDVGYGKTEVALRAAMKAVQDSKQVALLVPTTILAQQHYNTILSRFADFPVKAACLSRFQSPAERTLVKKRIADGTVDIVVGTHALLAKDIRFKDLGLLIIDEEHRFGVNHKEQIKALRQTVDVLTLSATPIPRTLNMSLSGVRDISVIETPPEERYPVQTFVLEYTDALLVDALTKEFARGGQAYVVSNRVSSMESLAKRIEALIPDVSVLIAHGQMPELQLENAMMDFMEHKADVLLCSTIIESGLDMPNVNTLIVLEAHRMGLAQLYQLRGRVGRSNRLGYAYFTLPENRELTEKASKRLMAIREFTQFGAGFQLAMRDLEIRGAGSLLGAEQHGHISDVGYEYYTKLVREAVEEAKGNPVLPEVETSVDIPIDAHIPHGYIKNEVQRLRVYRRIADIDSRDSLLDVTEELIDRYGDPPEAVRGLMETALIKAYARRAFLTSVTVRDGMAKLQFAEDAAIDGGRLIEAVSGMQGASLIAANPPGVLIQQPNRSAAEIAQLLPQFVYTIVRCVDVEEGL